VKYKVTIAIETSGTVIYQPHTKGICITRVLTVDIETPTPVQILCKDTSDYGAKSRCYCIHGTHNAHVKRPVTFGGQFSTSNDRGRKRGGTYRIANMSATQTYTKTFTPPPPSPWTVRPATNMVALTLTAQTRLPIRNIPLEIRIIGFRPNTSLNFPQNGILAAFARRYAEPVHAYSESGIWKSRDIEGRAVGIRTVSSATKKILSVSAQKHNIVGRVGRELDVDASPVDAIVVEMLVGRGVSESLSRCSLAHASWDAEVVKEVDV